MLSSSYCQGRGGGGGSGEQQNRGNAPDRWGVNRHAQIDSISVVTKLGAMGLLPGSHGRIYEDI